ncbi:MAG: hypothetical protein C0168_01525 [Candidatus Aminicenantes bacterium]|nr:MAG: hypothetical protein C0168_01525 [Candidatus Aminicenantes bacterium]
MKHSAINYILICLKNLFFSLIGIRTQIIKIPRLSKELSPNYLGLKLAMNLIFFFFWTTG